MSNQQLTADYMITEIAKVDLELALKIQQTLIASYFLITNPLMDATAQADNLEMLFEQSKEIMKIHKEYGDAYMEAIRSNGN